MEAGVRSAAIAVAKSQRRKALPSQIEGVGSPIIAPQSSFAARVQHGIGCLVARATDQRPHFDDGRRSGAAAGATIAGKSKTRTHLTTVSHQAPYRLIPLRSSSVRDAGAAMCYLSNYGGGLLPGDRLELDVRVEPNAKLGLLTQGSTRIYRQPVLSLGSSNHHNANNGGGGHMMTSMTRSRSKFVVEEGGLLVVAPDPVTPFASSCYEQDQRIYAHPESSVCIIDWLSAGRVTNGEVWQHHHLQLTNAFYVLLGQRSDDDPIPTFIDSVRLDPTHLLNLTPSFSCHAVASMTLYGDQVEEVVERCRQMQDLSMNAYTSTRRSSSPPPEDSEAVSTEQILASIGLSSRVLTSLSEISHPGSPSSAFVCRWAASSNEDLYRLLHFCLLPLSHDFGIEIYRDRIRATHSSPNAPAATSTGTVTQPPTRLQAVPIAPAHARHSEGDTSRSWGSSFSDTITNREKFWSTMILADSALPVGSFAHSNGLEAAAQLRLLTGGDGVTAESSTVEKFVAMTTQSTLELFTPAVMAANETTAAEEWLAVDRHLHLRLASNPPACRASLDQGRSLLRVFADMSGDASTSSKPSLLGDIDRMLLDERSSISSASNLGHLASIFGVVTALQGLNPMESCQLLGYCVARDLVSAAVRMNLLGPMESVAVLRRAHQAALKGIQEGRDTSPASASSSCSPLLDIIQPCHDALATRLFRT